MIKEIIEQPYNAHKSSGKFSVSGINGCWRKKYLQLKGLYKEKFDENVIRIFKIGDTFHRIICEELLTKSENRKWKVVAMEVNIPAQKYISGRVDVIMSDSSSGELIVVDIKSCGDYTLKAVRDGKCPENYINQVLLYCHFLKLRRGFLLFFGKHKGEIEEYEVIYNKEKAEKLVNEIINFYENYVNKNILPDKCDGGMFGCDVCKKEDEYWNEQKRI